MEQPTSQPEVGTVVVVTGGSSGIGRAIAVAFADAARRGQQNVRHPVTVVIADVDRDGGEETCKLVQDRGGQGVFIHTDVRDEAAVAALAEQVRSRHGALHYAAVNAGVEGPCAVTQDYPTSAFDALMAVNLRGSWLCLKHLLPLLVETGKEGAVVITSSIAGLRGMPEIAPYSASKHALIGLARSVALEYAGRVRINCVCPSGTDTPMVQRFVQQRPDWEQAATNLSNPIGRIARPEEVAEAVLWLCTSATYTTGSHLSLDGGAGA